MNIKDVDKLPEVQGDRLEMIFLQQTVLHNQYRSLEIKNGIGCAWIPATGFNIDEVCSQAYVKDLVWRVTEELAEAHEALLRNEYAHGQEEIADAFHFLVELCLIIKITPASIVILPYGQHTGRLKRLFNFKPRRDHKVFVPNRLSNMIWQPVYELGLACNCLKNKAWKMTQMETDVARMNTHVIAAFYQFIALCAYVGMGRDELFETYFKKAKVNEFRIRSHY